MIQTLPNTKLITLNGKGKTDELKRMKTQGKGAMSYLLKVQADTNGHEADTSGHAKVPMRLVALAILTGVAIALSVLVAVPFLHSITWGVALAIMGWPMHKLIRARVSQRSVASAISTAVVFLLIVVPGLFVAYQVGKGTSVIAQKADTTPSELISRENLEKLPLMGRVVEWMDGVNIDVETEVRKVITSVLPETNGVARGSVTATVQFLVALFILFYIFRDRGEFMQGLRELLPLTREESDHVFSSAADSVYANVYATVVTGLIDSVGGTLLFLYFGLPAAIMWGVVMFILSILPVVGAGMVWIPVAIYFAMAGNWPAASIIAVWGIFTAVAVDYVLYARLAGGRMRMHEVPALIAFLGGLAIFGLSGAVLGPAIVAVTVALLGLWRARNKGTGSAMVDAS